jgi:hypothetical protein
MNAKLTLSALVLAAGFAGSAFAESPLIQNDPFVGSRTRAEVQSELAAFQQSGVDPWDQAYNPLLEFTSTRSRGDVVAEYLAAHDEVKALNGEDSGSIYLAQMRGTQAAAVHVAATPSSAQ